jgi:hypothetical protein
MAGFEGQMTRAIIVASHRRSGTHLMLDLLRANAPGVSPSVMNLDRIDPTHPEHLPLAEFDRRLRARRRVVLVKTHALPDPRTWQSRAAGEYASDLIAASPTIYVHRDGRDVLASLYHYVASYSSDVAAQSFGDFLRARHNLPEAAGLSRPGYWQHHVFAWLDSRASALAGFAALRDDSGPTLRSLARQVGIEILQDIRTVTLDDRASRADALRGFVRRRLGRGPGRRSTAIRPRTGRSGSWHDAFDAEALALFRADASAGMARLGYDT